ncbi:DUF1838 family protein [Aquabacterium sp. OR-4]|uniref:DUF1838 family protein n=1 Tax=Aquabacterium sp. OR-4 TaxID=2978127 RepID=UPI0028C77567|nr:DUF1838 family protein [Aquabacterium sp. OR-4]MDT7836973.1 DUF1838 family protein [Aquabacterium sp. OR-4]
MNRTPNDRRAALRMAATAALAGAATGGASAQAAAPAPRPLAFDDPIWNREVSARLEAFADPKKFVYGSVTGVVTGVRDGEKVLPLMRFEVFSTIRVVRQPDASYQRLCREVVFYRSLETGQLMDEWDNPYTGERVKVVDVANDPYNYVISDFYPQPPSYGGLNKETRPRRPYIRNWRMLDADTVGLESDIHLLYPSAMQPEKWPRESPGKMTRTSEMFRYSIRRSDLEDPTLDNIPYQGVWNRITPWLPWMLMDQAPGHILYAGSMTARQTLEFFPKDVIARVRERHPKYLVAPEKVEGPSLSSLERYALEQTPAAPRAARKP